MQLKGNIEITNCIICGDENHILTEIMHWKDEALHFVICPTCGLKYMKKRPTANWYENFYKEEFWQKSRRVKRIFPNSRMDIDEITWEEADNNPDHEMTSIETWRENALNHAERAWNIIRPVIPLSKNDLVLDIGSSFGETAHLIKEKCGCSVYSVEPSELGRSYIEKRGIPLIGRTIEEMAGVEEFYGKADFMIIGYVLENTNDPLNNLKIMRRLLSPNGKIFIDTSNVYYNNAINPYHPFIFSPETLSALLGLAGFEVAYQVVESNPMEIDHIESIEKAIWFATIAAPSDTQESWQAPKYPIKTAQARGLSLVERKKAENSSL